MVPKNYNTKFKEPENASDPIAVNNLPENKVHHQAISQIPQHLRCSDKLHYSPPVLVSSQIPLEFLHLPLSIQKETEGQTVETKEEKKIRKYLGERRRKTD